MVSDQFIALGVLGAAVLVAGGVALQWYRRRVWRRQRQSSWRELCLRLELAPQPGSARVARGELQNTGFLLHDTGTNWLVELSLAQPVLPPGMVLLSAQPPMLPPRVRMRLLEWEAAVSQVSGMRAWSTDLEEASSKVEASEAFLEQTVRAMQAHAPLRVESRRAVVSALGEDGDKYRYPQTPPEFIEFGRLGGDGVSYGFLVLAPELPRSDWPQVEFQPMDGDGVGALGDCFRDTVELLTSRALSSVHKQGEMPSAEDKARLERVAKALSIAPSPRKARWSSQMAYAPAPPVPRGWVHQPAKDGVGVLAPAKAFHPWQRRARRNPWKPLEIDTDDPDATVCFARRAVADGYPATALLALNECFHRHWSGWRYPDAAKRLRPERRRAYLALERRAHARALARTPDP